MGEKLPGASWLPGEESRLDPVMDSGSRSRAELSGAVRPHGHCSVISAVAESLAYQLADERTLADDGYARKPAGLLEASTDSLGGTRWLAGSSPVGPAISGTTTYLAFPRLPFPQALPCICVSGGIRVNFRLARRGRVQMPAANHSRRTSGGRAVCCTVGKSGGYFDVLTLSGLMSENCPSPHVVRRQVGLLLDSGGSGCKFLKRNGAGSPGPGFQTDEG